VIFCAKEKFWRALVDALEVPALAYDARFATFADRLVHKTELLAVLEPRFRTRPTAEWLARLRGRVPCAPVNTVREALADEQVRARDMILEVAHPEFGLLREVASPIKTAGALTRPGPAPALGQHTDEVLRDLLGYDARRIHALRTSGAVGAAPRAPAGQ
jgi:crotonobetainyl-CoA:carnitine CoA-transferase CaiB-like acyl-CoA transferase